MGERHMVDKFTLVDGGLRLPDDDTAENGCKWCDAPTHGTARCLFEGIPCRDGLRHSTQRLSSHDPQDYRQQCIDCGLMKGIRIGQTP